MNQVEAPSVTRTFRLVPGTWKADVTQLGSEQLEKSAWARPEPKPRTNGIRKAGPASANEELQTVRRAIAGDSEALSALFARDRRRLYHAAFSLLRNKEDAEDALQDGLLSAYLNLGSFEGRSRFSTWLTRIVLNAALMNRRRQHTRLRVCLDENEVYTQRLLAGAVDARPGPEQAYASVETRALVERRAGQLSPLLQSAFYLRDVNELSASEISKATGVKVSAIKSRAVRARHRLAGLLGEKGVYF